jgi:hypothetical protein
MSDDVEVFQKSVQDQKRGADVPDDELAARIAEALDAELAKRTPLPRPKTRAEFDRLSDADRKRIGDHLEADPRPATRGQLFDMSKTILEIVAQNTADRMNEIVEKLNEHTDKIAEIDKRPIPKFVKVLRPQPESSDE